MTQHLEKLVRSFVELGAQRMGQLLQLEKSEVRL